MNENEAKIEGNWLVVGDAELVIVLPRDRPDEELLNEIAKRWNVYTQLIEFLGDAEFVFNCAILRTPTGDVRNKCTELNIKRMILITGEPAKPKEVSNERP